MRWVPDTITWGRGGREDGRDGVRGRGTPQGLIYHPPSNPPSPKLCHTPDFCLEFFSRYDPGLRGAPLVPAVDGLRRMAIFGGRKQGRGSPVVRMSVGWTLGDLGQSLEYCGLVNVCLEYCGEPLSPPQRLISRPIRCAASANGGPGPIGLALPPGKRLCATSAPVRGCQAHLQQPSDGAASVFFCLLNPILGLGYSGKGVSGKATAHWCLGEHA